MDDNDFFDLVEVERVIDFAVGSQRAEDSSSDDDLTQRGQEASREDGTLNESQGASSAMDNREPENHRQFDTHLTSLHSYLGEELETVRGRTVLEDHSELTLDLLQHADVVLMPGQTLPLTVSDPRTANMLRNCIKNDHTFGVLAAWTDGIRTNLSKVGTTAEIYEYLPEQQSFNMRVKAKARQRFRLLSLDAGRWQARVRILPEVRLPDPLHTIQIQGLHKQRNSPQKRQRFRRLDAAVTQWPAFVFEQYNVQRLTRDIKKELKTILIGGNKEKANPNIFIPEDESELSFWVAQNMPLKEEHRLLLLKLDSPIQRLRFELHALQSFRQILYCGNCMNMIGSSRDIFSMSSEGPHGTYVNPGGFLHETITLYKVKNIFSVGYPSTEFSWFPGYGWSISKCRHCGQHMGWKFKATSDKLKPLKFWGICRRSITVKMASLNSEQPENNLADRMTEQRGTAVNSRRMPDQDWPLD